MAVAERNALPNGAGRAHFIRGQSCARASFAILANLPDAGKYRKSDERGSDFGLQEGTKAFARSIRDSQTRGLCEIDLAVLNAEQMVLNSTDNIRGNRWRRAPARRIPRGDWRLAAVIFAALAALSAGTLASAQTISSSEYQVKAAFLFHFAQFVEWPEETFKDAGSPLIYCTIGEDPFQGSLDATINGNTKGPRPFRVQHLRQPREIQGCQVLFIGVVDKRVLPAILAGAKGNSVLTVGEFEHFAQEGGMIGFLLEENKIRFEINLEAAQKANLKLSSRLLALAKSVIGGQRGT